MVFEENQSASGIYRDMVCPGQWIYFYDCYFISGNLITKTVCLFSIKIVIIIL
jgi:hypothetical protein